MKHVLLVLSLFAGVFFSTAQESKGNTITVVIENVLSDEGTILVGLHSKDTFMVSDGVRSASSKATVGEVSMSFDNIMPGTYAVMVMHDKNDNMQMDLDANYMPLEDYGMSGKTNLFGPPVFEDAKFELDNTDKEIRIRF